MSQIFKIRDRVTGNYSNGGMYPGFKGEGKTWSSMAKLKSHLSMFRDHKQSYSLPNTYKDAEIVVFNTVEVQSIDVEQFLQQNQSKKR